MKPSGGPSGASSQAFINSIAWHEASAGVLGMSITSEQQAGSWLWRGPCAVPPMSAARGGVCSRHPRPPAVRSRVGGLTSSGSRQRIRESETDRRASLFDFGWADRLADPLRTEDRQREWTISFPGYAASTKSARHGRARFQIAESKQRPSGSLRPPTSSSGVSLRSFALEQRAARRGLGAAISWLDTGGWSSARDGRCGKFAPGTAKKPHGLVAGVVFNGAVRTVRNKGHLRLGTSCRLLNRPLAVGPGRFLLWSAHLL